jgi:hypothetical protein
MIGGVKIGLIAVMLAMLCGCVSVSGMFKLNKECQEEGYYMGEFEFKMLGFAYYLDKGHYLKAYTGMRTFQKQLESRTGLIKVPHFNDKKQEMEFYLNLQNPRTGAFMDDSFPACTYNEATENVIQLLAALAKETGQPLRLKYPLKYLDDMNTPEKLIRMLDDLSTAGWIAAKLPQTCYVFARSILSFANGEGVIEKNHLYQFSLEWKQTLLRWFYENQDRRTGFWGPKSRKTGELLTLDITNTASIIKAFVDANGNDIHPDLPLRYKNEMFASALQVMSRPMPADDELDELHEWALKMGKGSYLLTRYLWRDASVEHKAQAKKILENYVKTYFLKYFISNEGAFSYYPGATHATLDGTSGIIGLFKDLGAFSSEKQSQLWGSRADTARQLGTIAVSQLTEQDLGFLNDAKNVNSWRFYPVEPDGSNYTSNVAGVYYPQATPVLDIVDLLPKIRQWLDTTSQSMGNWVSREEILQQMSAISLAGVTITKDAAPLAQLNRILSEHKRLTLIGFDVLQIPTCQVTLALAVENRNDVKE